MTYFSILLLRTITFGEVFISFKNQIIRFKGINITVIKRFNSLSIGFLTLLLFSYRKDVLPKARNGFTLPRLNKILKSGLGEFFCCT